MTVKPQEDLQRAHRQRKSRESFLETFESIIVAFVLAFVFRAFVVEAFVIPTGSMGPTLYGAHLEFKCSDCGYEFAMGSDGTQAAQPVCPNCFLAQRVPPRVPLYSGDRILVLKYLYDFEPPQRWDVIVFRNPNEPSQNYIKRLIALPGETVELVRGDVTIDGHIVQKTDAAQDALWMLVHDTRWRPTRTQWQPRWVVEKGWEPEQSGFVLREPLPGGRMAWLAYRHRDPTGKLANIHDFYAYNSGVNGTRFGANICTDLRLKTEATAGRPETIIAIEMRAYKDRIKFELTSEGTEQPTRILLNDRVVAQAAAGVLPVGRPVTIEAANVDHKIMLLVGGKRVTNIRSMPASPQGDILYEPKALTPEELEQFASPDPNNPRTMASEVRIGAAGGPASLAYLRLDRDVYYTNAVYGSNDPGRGTEGNALTLQADEFFVCGDNSPKSHDSRWWPLERPVVPRRNLVGKAFFVYWPAAGKRQGIPLAPDPTGWRLVH